MGILTRIGCFLIGWKVDILKDCGEASHRTFKKLTSAITIMMILWGTIGYCFADRYINIESVSGKFAVSIAFMIIVLCIERIIILAVGKASWTHAFRCILAVCMSMLGACIFDQIIFKNDLEIRVAEVREQQIKATIKQRLELYNEDIQRISFAIDSIGRVNMSLYGELQKNPVIKTTDVSNREIVAGVDSLGNPIKTKATDIVSRSIENPIAAQTKANENQLSIYQEQLQDLQESKKEIDKNVRAEFAKRKIGFIEELNATYDVLTGSTLSIIFYVILFIVLLSLELFVVTIKSGDTKCDYDLIVEHQLNIKKQTLQNSEDRLLNRQ